MMGGKTPKTC